MALVGSEKSYSKLFFVISGLLITLALYSFYDEFVVRRPWKIFQNEFNRLELQAAQIDFEKEQAKFVKTGGKKKITELKLKVEELEAEKETDAFEEVVDKYDDLSVEFDDLERKIKFNKSILDAYYYEWKHAFQTDHDYKEKEVRYKKLEAKIKKQQAELEGIREKRDEAKQTIDGVDNQIAKLNEKIYLLEKPLNDAQKVIDNIKTRVTDTNIKQVVIEDLGVGGNIYWGKVDRCQTCHIASDKGGYENAAKAFRLTVVADTKAVKDLEAKKPELAGRVITQKQQKYLQIMYGTHPKRKEIFGAHPVADYGCTSCHGGNGRGLQIKGLAFLDEDEDLSKYDPAEVTASSGLVAGAFGHKDMSHATHHHGIEPLLRGNQSESNCLSCHNGQIYIEGAKTLTKGLELFADLGCNGCHLVKGYEKLYKAGPGLNHVASKVTNEWLVDWIKNPYEYNPSTKMPMFGLSDDEVVAVSSFLVNNSQDYSPKHRLALNGSISNGKKLFNEVGCRGCHKADDSKQAYSTRGRASNLSRIAAKVQSKGWIYDWIKNPKNFDAHSRMPSLRLSDSEAADITAYLMSQNTDYKEAVVKRSGHLADKVDPNNKALVAQGKKIIGNRGCYACHNIKGFEKAERIGPQLTKEALKEPFEFDFGDALKKDFVFKSIFGEEVFVGHNYEQNGALTKDVIDHVKVPKDLAAKVQKKTNLVDTWQSWIRNKLKYPLTIYDHDRAELKMPNFNLRPDEVDALIAFLKAQKDLEVPERYDASKTAYAKSHLAGQKLVAQYNCMGCHNIYNFGGDIQKSIDAYTMGDDDFAAPKIQYYPPSLDHVGMKIRPEWLYDFLDNPKPYRAAMIARMPTYDFSEDEINTLIDYFAAMDKVNPEYTETNYKLSQERIKVGQFLASNDVYQCFTCHIKNGQTPAGKGRDDWAPDWAKMHDRLQYDFIPLWIQNPVAYQQHAIMPGYLQEDEPMLSQYYNGNHDELLDALRDYILSVGE